MLIRFSTVNLNICESLPHVPVSEALCQNQISEHVRADLEAAGADLLEALAGVPGEGGVLVIDAQEEAGAVLAAGFGLREVEHPAAQAPTVETVQEIDALDLGVVRIRFDVGKVGSGEQAQAYGDVGGVHARDPGGGSGVECGLKALRRIPGGVVGLDVGKRDDVGKGLQKGRPGDRRERLGIRGGSGGDGQEDEADALKGCHNGRLEGRERGQDDQREGQKAEQGLLLCIRSGDIRCGCPRQSGAQARLEGQSEHHEPGETGHEKGGEEQDIHEEALARAALGKS